VGKTGSVSEIDDQHIQLHRNIVCRWFVVLFRFSDFGICHYWLCIVVLVFRRMFCRTPQNGSGICRLSAKFRRLKCGPKVAIWGVWGGEAPPAPMRGFGWRQPPNARKKIYIYIFPGCKKKTPCIYFLLMPRLGKLFWFYGIFGVLVTKFREWFI